MGFEPTIPVFEQEKTFHALDHATTAIGSLWGEENILYSYRIHIVLLHIIFSSFCIIFLYPCSVTPSVPQAMQCRVPEWSLNNELERLQKDAVEA
jgi:hypothetical protein